MDSGKQMPGFFLLSDDIAFENMYEAEGGIILDGEKILTGREMIAADRFTFTVYEGEVKVAEGVSSENGKIVFTEIRYTQENIGTHIYKIVEDDTSVPVIVKDEAVYTVTVTVTDKGDGTMIAEADDGDGFIFDNTYNATGSFDPEAILYMDEAGQLPAQDEILDLRNGEDTVYYVVEEPVKGMQTTYTSIAPYSDVTDRVYNGGTIINIVIPPTGDSANPLVWILRGLSAVGIGFVLCVSAGRKKHIR